MMKQILKTGAATISIMLGAPAFAQTAPAAPGTPAAVAEPTDTAPGDIIVTAQKRNERLQDVPVAVTVVTGDAIDSLGRTSLEGAQYLVPSLNFVKSGTALNQALFLRGIGTTSFSIAVEPTVSTVLDGVVLSRAAEAFTDLVDIDRLEVLRGPQGTLFGKNASAGVINIVSRRPGSKVGGYAEGSVFFVNGLEYRARGAIDLPFSPSIRTRTTAFYDNYDGNLFNVAPNVNRRVNGFEHYGVRSIIAADVSDNVALTIIGDYHHNDDDCCAEVIGGPPLTAAGAVNTANLALIQTVLPPLAGDRTRTLNQNLVTRTIETGWGFSGQADITLGTQTVTSITSYRNFANNEIRDGDFLSQPYIAQAGSGTQSHDTGPQTGDTFTQELRLTSPGKELIDYVIGGFFSRTYSRRIFQRDNISCAAVSGAVLPAGVYTPCTSTLAQPTVSSFGRADYGSISKNVAVFAQGTLNLSQRFRFIGGVRFTHDQLDGFETRTTSPGNGASNPRFDQGVYNEYLRLTALGTAPATAATAAAAASNGVPFRLRTSSDNFSGKAGIQFDFSRNTTSYASYTRGYKGPAFNLFFNLVSTGVKPLEPETSNSYEIGLKNTLFGGKLTLNLAAYYAQYYNFQANNPDTLTTGNPPTTTTIARFTNAGTVSTRGGELDFTFRPVRNLNLSGGVAYTDAHVDAFNGSGSAVVPSGTPLGFAPKWKADLAADYRIRTGGAIDFGLGGQGSYQSSQLALFVADPVQRANGTIHPYALVNLSASIIEKDDHYRLTFQVRNLFDQSFAAAIATGGPAGAYRYQIPRDADRYFGVTGRVNF